MHKWYFEVLKNGTILGILDVHEKPFYLFGTPHRSSACTCVCVCVVPPLQGRSFARASFHGMRTPGKSLFVRVCVRPCVRG